MESLGANFSTNTAVEPRFTTSVAFSGSRLVDPSAANSFEGSMCYPSTIGSSFDSLETTSCSSLSPCYSRSCFSSLAASSSFYLRSYSSSSRASYSSFTRSSSASFSAYSSASLYYSSSSYSFASSAASSYFFILSASCLSNSSASRFNFSSSSCLSRSSSTFLAAAASCSAF